MGSLSAPIVVICDAPTHKLWHARVPLGGPPFDLFRDMAERHGFNADSFAFITPCAPIPANVDGSDRREKQYIDQYREALHRTLLSYDNAKLVVFTGKHAGYALTGKPIKITQQRGVVRQFDRVANPVLPMLSPQHVLRRPELKDIMATDFNMLKIIADGDFHIDAAAQAIDNVTYEWREDISDILANPPRGLSLDTETAKRVGMEDCGVPSTRWYRPEIVPLTVQFSFEPGHAIVCPVDRDYWPMHPRTLSRLKSQLKELCENPDIKKVSHNIKFDHHILYQFGINTKGWFADTQLLAFFADENMLDKSQDECVRRWLPGYAGYADSFNAKTDKDNMRTVSHEDMLRYAGGDVDSNWQLAKILLKLVRRDERQWNCCQRIQFPALLAFAEVVERQGIMIDTDALITLQGTLTETSVKQYKELIKMVPPAIKRKHLAAEKTLEFSRADFVRDILFTKEGFNLTPKVFTKSTAKLAEDQKIPSTSVKDHLPYFKDDNSFVAKYIDHSKIAKVQNTYVGTPEGPHGPTGFWQYLHEGYIHPSFLLHGTVTGRSSSREPNGQNIPKHGPIAKAYRKIFIAKPGYVLIETDLSQAELRLVAWMSGDPVMLDVYRRGGDIHLTSAAMSMNISEEQFALLDEKTRKEKRQAAKAINFGYVFGMSWRKFMTYAKTTYNVTFTEVQAQAVRDGYFKKFKRLTPWHNGMREFVRGHGYVRALHGAVRHLPNIYSTDEMIRGECERQSINSSIQRFGSDIGLCAMARLCRDVDPEFIRPMAFIHDALVCEVPEERKDEAMSALKFYMQSVPYGPWFNLKPPLPILADVSAGYNLSEMEEMKHVESIAPEWYDMLSDGFADMDEAYQYGLVQN